MGVHALRAGERGMKYTHLLTHAGLAACKHTSCSHTLGWQPVSTQIAHTRWVGGLQAHKLLTHTGLAACKHTSCSHTLGRQLASTQAAHTRWVGSLQAHKLLTHTGLAACEHTNHTHAGLAACKHTSCSHTLGWQPPHRWGAMSSCCSSHMGAGRGEGDGVWQPSWRTHTHTQGVRQG